MFQLAAAHQTGATLAYTLPSRDQTRSALISFTGLCAQTWSVASIVILVTTSLCSRNRGDVRGTLPSRVAVEVTSDREIIACAHPTWPHVAPQRLA